MRSELLSDEFIKNFAPCAMWSSDCQGKKDYDGRFLSISCRYYPGKDQPGGSLVSDGGKFTTLPYGDKPSAYVGIVLNHGTPDEPDGYQDYIKLVEAEITGEDEADTKAKVEAWVVERCREILTVLRGPK